MSERITFSLMRVPNDTERPPRPAGIVVFDNPSHGIIVVSGSHRHQMLYEALLSACPEFRESREKWQDLPSLRNEPAFCVGYTDRVSVNPVVNGTHHNKTTPESCPFGVTEDTVDLSLRALYLAMKGTYPLLDPPRPAPVAFTDEQLAAVQR